ncbi:MAG: RNA polymerase sigma-54 factor, partial [Bryobacterales bacterium]|nr:RNA polymerase sigma-54 factor [Bryobacterales bacterium]
MSTLSPRLQVRVQQKQTLTPGLVQMVSLLQLNRLELKDMITAEVAQNPVLEEATEGGEELSPEELQPLLEAEAERTPEHPDQSILDASGAEPEAPEAPEPGEFEVPDAEAAAASVNGLATEASAPALEAPETPATTDPFDEIDLGDYFDNYLDPGFKSPASENIEKP